VRRTSRPLVVLLALVVLPGCLSLPTVAAAKQSVQLTATLTPERLGHGTSIGLAIQIEAPAAKVPSPLRQIDLRYPANFGIALSGLGIETCTAATLEMLGPSGCPPDSVMGHGSAIGEIPFGPEIIREGASVTIVRAEDQSGQIALLLDAEGLSPVKANIVLSGVLLPASAPYGGDLRIDVPLVPSLPEAPDVAVVQLRATIGPAAGLAYTESVHGRAVSYTPKGILLPDRCPRGGFAFAAGVAFEDGSSARGSTTVRCPSSRRRAGKRASRASTLIGAEPLPW
jgi:hypothetical protein